MNLTRCLALRGCYQDPVLVFASVPKCSREAAVPRVALSPCLNSLLRLVLVLLLLEGHLCEPVPKGPQKGFVSCLLGCLWSVQRCTHFPLRSLSQPLEKDSSFGTFLSVFIPALVEWVQRSVATSSGPILMKETECLGCQNWPFAKQPRESLSSRQACQLLFALAWYS